MEFVCNDKSLTHNPLQNPYEIKNVISAWVRLLHERKDEIKAVYVEGSFYNFSINGVYGLQDWLKDKTVRREEQQFLRSRLNKNIIYPVDFQDFQNSPDYPQSLSFDYHEAGKISAPCGVVALGKEIPLLSFATDEAWTRRHITAYVTDKDWLERHADSENTLELENASNQNHVTEITAGRHQNALKSVASGQDLWEKRRTLFPNLDFCERVKNDLISAPRQNHIRHIVEKLSLLNEYYSLHSTYQSANFPDGRDESDTVKNDPKLRGERHFKKPDGSYDYFYKHISFSGDFAGRIYYLPDDTNQKFYIGYIGKHLRTQKY